MEVLDTSAAEIRSALLRLQSEYLERKLKPYECIRRAYDAIATQQVNSGVSLSDRQLKEIIPGAVFEAALQFGWIENPWKRTEYRPKHLYLPNAYIPQDRHTSVPVLVDIPDHELTVQLGRYKVTRAYHEWWISFLASPIAAWEAEALRPSASKTTDATGVPTRSKRQGQRFETPAGLQWKDILIRFLDGHTVTITAGSNRTTYLCRDEHEGWPQWKSDQAMEAA